MPHRMRAQSPAGIETPPPRRPLDRPLHRIYHPASGAGHFIRLRLRPAGVAVGVVLVLAACLGIGHPRSPILELLSFSIALVLICLSWAMLRRTTLHAVRELPGHATAGTTVRMAVQVHNHGRRSVSRAWLHETAPDPRPDANEFCDLREPGEHERNRFDRTFAYFRWQWLLLHKRFFTGGFSQDEIRLAPGARTCVFIEFTPLRRGVIRLRDMRAWLPDPLGLFQRCVPVMAPPATVLVLPRRHPLPPLELPGVADFRVNGESTSNQIGTSGEFVGLRDYRPGDPPRQIHWKSWARTGRPIVRELEDTFYPRLGLVLDTLSTRETDDCFEDCISVAASFAPGMDTGNTLIDLMFIENKAHIVTAGRDVERGTKLLETLAGIRPSRHGVHRELAQWVLRHRDGLASCIVILNGWDDSRAELLTSLRTAGITCSALIIGRGPRPQDVPGHWLESGHIGRDLMRLPPRI